ncbi:hypothetical protein Lal_00039159 [Lupinus albus]|nr:hypothetical protein Lal_00039159 [Lupinus albus]
MTHSTYYQFLYLPNLSTYLPNHYHQLLSILPSLSLPCSAFTSKLVERHGRKNSKHDFRFYIWIFQNSMDMQKRNASPTRTKT